ncbi:MAG: hemerythrin domain-containing protein [Chitinophagaceae bacterium]|nr:hemerythrin domain-containing protein [Chitinophagaceae bacterium]
MPIKRSEQIKPLSIEHHTGLLFCWKIRTGIRNNIELERIKRYVNHFMKYHLSPHFLEEEKVLFNRLKHELCDKAIDEHLEIKKMIANINEVENNSYDVYNKLADTIDDHIRFEERILFPLLESNLKQDVLVEIGKKLAENEQLKEIAWMVSHRLRKPVATILGLSQLLNKSAINDEESLELIDNLIHEVEGLDSIIKEVDKKTHVLGDLDIDG